MAGLDWPAITRRNGNIMLALLFQLEQSQWWPPERLRVAQFRQAGQLLRHARATVPHYRERLKDLAWDGKAPPDADLWAQLPLLRRQDIQANEGRALLSECYPKSHGTTRKVHTAGSSGKPLTVVSSNIAAIFWNVISLRDTLWRRLDCSAKIAAIRLDENKLALYPEGVVMDYWLKSTRPFLATGPCAVLNISTPIDRQIEWLMRQKADYLITYPSNLEALLHHCLDKQIRLPGLSRVQTLSEVLHPRATWRASISSAAKAGSGNR